MKFFTLGILALASLGTASASDTIFPINNKLAEVDLNQNAFQYSKIFNSLVKDLKENGLGFSYDGTEVRNDYRGKPYFLVKNVRVYIKKEIFEKNEEYSTIVEKQTFFNNAIKDYGQSYIFSNLEYAWAKPKLKIKMDLLDSNNRSISSRQIKTNSMLNDGTGVSFEHFFKYINRINKDNRIFDDVDISENISVFRDKEFDIGLDEIQNIRSIRFRVDYN